jgi:hypothetical protein
VTQRLLDRIVSLPAALACPFAVVRRYNAVRSPAEKSMEAGPARELLEATHQFPGTYVFKVIGRNEDDFVDRVLAMVRATLGSEDDPPHQLKHTANGHHVSVTVEPWVESADDVLAIYAEIRLLSGLVMLW